MKSNFHDIASIEKYLSGSLSSSEVISFEKQLASDPLLSNEVSLQKDIIDGLKKHRNTELKSRLSGLTPYPNYINIAKWTWLGIAASGMITAGILYLTQPSISKQVIAYNTIDYQASCKKQLTDNLIASTDNTIIIREERSSSTTLSEAITSTNKDVQSNIEQEKAILPSIDSPNNHLFALDEEREISFSNPNAKEKKESHSSSNELTANNASVDINVTYSEDGLAYTFDEDRLTLVGRFDKDYPYTIYELNFKKKMYFINYKGDYYRIKKTTSLRKFSKLTDQDTIDKLNNLDN
ncbi:MAG: hypothetical protein AB8B61_02040 [Cyclobacteriaceae bacterium]